MAACVASGTTTIQKASIEPETLDLVELLRRLGADIQVDKTQQMIKVTGKRRDSYKMPKCDQNPSKYRIYHTVIPDRIVAGTYAIAAVITGKDKKYV